MRANVCILNAFWVKQIVTFIYIYIYTVRLQRNQHFILFGAQNCVFHIREPQI